MSDGAIANQPNPQANSPKNSGVVVFDPGRPVEGSANRSFESSPTLGRLALALAKAQGQMAAAARDAVNPHLRSKYADLASIWEACREPLSKNGLAVVQLPSIDGKLVSVRAVLMHESGEWISCMLSAESADATPQRVGSTETYLRRYTLAPLVGVAAGDDDDDGEKAQGRHTERTPPADPFPDNEPVAPDLDQRIGAGFKTLGGDAKTNAAICRAVTGVTPDRLTNGGAKKLIEALRKAATEKMTSAQMLERLQKEQGK